MKILICVKKYILIFGIALTLAMLGLFLIYGDSTERIKLSLLTVIIPAVFYGFVRLLFFIISKNASNKIMTVFSYFFIIACLLGAIFMLITFITNFPNTTTPSTASCFAVVLAVLDYNTMQTNRVDKL